MTVSTWRQALAHKWAALAPRERLSVQAAGAVLLAFLLWTVAIAPALQVLRQAPAQHRELEARLQRMQLLKSQAEAWRTTPQQRSPRWREELGESVRALGEASLSWNGNSATVRLQDCPPQALGAWLADLAPRWQMTVGQASLRADERGLWQGQITLQRP